MQVHKVDKKCKVSLRNPTVDAGPVIVPIHLKRLSPSGNAEMPLFAAIIKVMSSCWSLQRKQKFQKKQTFVISKENAMVRKGSSLDHFEWHNIAFFCFKLFVVVAFHPMLHSIINLHISRGSHYLYSIQMLLF